MERPMLSMVMCTRNRAEQLRRVLESAAAMVIPPGQTWEFLLVDNGSTDHTAEVVAAFADRLPIRRVWQPEAGLSNARNAGVAAASGDYILWTDDDVVIDPGWLAAYADAFKAYPDAAIFGGVIEPVYEVEPPQWFRENEDLLSHLVAKRDFGPERRVLENDLATIPYGANFALRTAEQKRHRYDPELGVSPNHKRLGEETAVIQAIRNAGGVSVWVPGARVHHLIPASRMTPDYVRIYNRSRGETWAHLSATGGPEIMGPAVPRDKGKWIAGMPAWVIKRSIKSRIRGMQVGRQLTRARIESITEIAFLDGALRYYWRRR